ncbi:MAG: DUF1634 domain-containing protein [Bdellovibrionaceae bacterium]|nr:DUF1634 domain-containing protein [Pseudobdellovibrionaceae bacterium]
MAEAKKGFSLSTERGLVQGLMRGGLILSALLMGLGLFLHMQQGELGLHGISMWEIFRGQLPLADFLLTAGIFILALTPAFRVILLGFLWASEKDWRFVGVAVLVMVTLILSISLGGH